MRQGIVALRDAVSREAHLRRRGLAGRFGRALLELGGTNASIVTPSADLDMTLRAVAFGAMGLVAATGLALVVSVIVLATLGVPALLSANRK